MSDVRDIIAVSEREPPAPSITELTCPPELAGYEDEQDPSVGIAWRIENLQSADWALMRLAECEAEATELDREFRAAFERLSARLEALKAKAERGAGFFRFKLSEYAERERKTLLHGKKKSRELLHGKLGFRSKPERLEVVDKDALAAWLATQPVESGTYRIRMEPEMRALQERFRTSGEVPPGCDVKPSEEAVIVEAVSPERALGE